MGLIYRAYKIVGVRHIVTLFLNARRVIGIRYSGFPRKFHSDDIKPPTTLLQILMMAQNLNPVWRTFICN